MPLRNGNPSTQVVDPGSNRNRTGTHLSTNIVNVATMWDTISWKIVKKENVEHPRKKRKYVHFV